VFKKSLRDKSQRESKRGTRPAEVVASKSAEREKSNSLRGGEGLGPVPTKEDLGEDRGVKKTHVDQQARCPRAAENLTELSSIPNKIPNGPGSIGTCLVVRVAEYFAEEGDREGEGGVEEVAVERRVPNWREGQRGAERRKGCDLQSMRISSWWGQSQRRAG
jgi:hypothetical protein